MKIRINQFIAKSGYCSRRKAEYYILNKSVKVNDCVITELSTIIDTDKDVVQIGESILKTEEKKYFVFYKPKNVVTSLNDPECRPIVLDYFSKIKERIFPVGRLDFDSEGLLFMTNDGDFANKLMHPSFEKNKVYIATVNKKLTFEQLNEFKNGIIIDNKKTSKSQIMLVENIKNGLYAYTYKVIIHEGRNRQIRKMFEYFDINVVNLKRTEIAGIALNNLKSGEYRELTKDEFNKLMRMK